MIDINEYMLLGLQIDNLLIHNVFISFQTTMLSGGNMLLGHDHHHHHDDHDDHDDDDPFDFDDDDDDVSIEG